MSRKISASGIGVRMCGGVLLGLALAGTSIACDPYRYRQCACAKWCDQDYCESQGQLEDVSIDPVTERIVSCFYHWTPCMCGALGCEPPTGSLIRFLGLVMPASEARAESGQAEKPDQAERFISNAHGDFSVVRPSESEQESAGVGLRLAVTEGELIVGEVGEDGPAERAGIKKGDVIVSIDGKAMRGVDLGRAVHDMRGKPGTLVVLRVRSKDGKGIGRKVPLIRKHLLFKPKGAPQSSIRVRHFDKSDKAEKCAPERDSCLLLNEEEGRCFYSCKVDEPSAPKGN